MHVWDLRLTSDQRTDLAVPDGYTTALVVLKGALRVNGSEPVAAAEVGLFDRAGTSICIDCAHDATALLLCGAPIDEPIVGHGPFVMNSAAGDSPGDRGLPERQDGALSMIACAEWGLPICGEAPAPVCGRQRKGAPWRRHSSKN